MMKSFMTVLFALTAACGDLDNGIHDTRCGAPTDTSDVTVEATDSPTLATGSASVKVRGTAEQSLGLAIRRITVAGLDAASDSFNFSAWSIDVPADVVQIRVPAGTTLPTTVTLPVVAYDVCNGDTPAVTTMAKVTVGP